MLPENFHPMRLFRLPYAHNIMVTTGSGKNKFSLNGWAMAKKYGFAAAISQRTDTFAERQQLVSVGMVFLLSTGRNLALENIRMFCFLPDIVKAQIKTERGRKGCRNRFRRSNCERGFYHESVD